MSLVVLGVRDRLVYINRPLGLEGGFAPARLLGLLLGFFAQSLELSFGIRNFHFHK